ncbi:MAG TPA: group II truncated hemoglobin [Hyphomonadaceae bacterium]|nr:group II truncated hemoglobin [Hyphomonadaceae bacterium]HPI48377.1 group II truncated hemoglobin [Hyphomonadaceae bacterium]
MSDEKTAKPIPTLSEWAGGPQAFERLTEKFYSRVPNDPVLAPVFAGMDPHHAVHVAHFVSEVFGGPRAYTADGGSHAHMISRHLGRHLTHEQRKRWIELMLQTADEVGLPDDPEFRAAFVGYLEWGTRLAVLNSQNGVTAPADDPPMPTWGWGPPGGPWQG